MKKAIFFDLDATLLTMSQKEFEHEYFATLTKKVIQNGFDGEKFQTTLWKCVKAMWTNPGNSTNEELFWEVLLKSYPNQKDVFEPIFIEFYNNEYNEIKHIVKPNKYVRQIVDYAKQNFEYVVLATNPFFPANGVKNRMAWNGLDYNEFDYVTSYENSHYSKPDKRYYKEIMSKLNLKPQDCIMVGNNELEDYITAKSIGMQAILAGEFIIPYNEVDTHPQVVLFENLIEEIEKLKDC